VPRAPGQQPGADPGGKEGSTTVRKWTASACAVIAAALIAGPVTVAGRGRWRDALRRRARDRTRVILASHDRLIVMYSRQDDTICVLAPPGEDPQAVLRAARLVVPDEKYARLARHLGAPGSRPPG
jgi:hypothetical protein